MSHCSSKNEVSRRDFLCVIAGCAAAAVGSCMEPTHTAFFRKHLKELSPQDVQAILDDLELELAQRYGKPVQVGMQEALPGVDFAYALDLSRCIGCRRCVTACV